MSERLRPMDTPAARPAPGRRGAWLALAGLVVLGHVWLIDAWLRRPPAEDRVGTPAPLAALDTRTARAEPVPETVPAPKPEPVAVAAPSARPAPVRAPAATAHPAAVPTARLPPVQHHDAEAPAPHAAVARKTPEQPAVLASIASAVTEPAVPPATKEETATESVIAPMPDPAMLLAMAPTGAGPIAAAVSTGATSALASNLPPSAQLSYRMSKGLLSGTGRIDWALTGDTYHLRLEARVPVLGQIFQQTSEGRIDANGVAPVRHTESAIRRSQRAVNFVRDSNPPRIQFSAREGSEPLRTGAQDRVSWIAQLAGRLGARAQADWTPGSHIEMDVASVGGDVQHWVFTIVDHDSNNQWHLRREANGPRDTRAEVWLDPARHLWPTRIRLTEPTGDPLELTLSAIESS